MTARARIHVRAAAAADLPFVRELAVESIVHGIPAGRRVSPAAAREYARSSAARLDEWLARDDLEILIAEMSGDAVGYLILDLADREPSTGERQAFIVGRRAATEGVGTWATTSWRPRLVSPPNAAWIISSGWCQPITGARWSRRGAWGFRWSGIRSCGP